MPRLSVTEFSGHGIHALLFVAPTPSVMEFSGHAVHALLVVAPLLGLYVDFGHGVAAAAPSVDTYVPGGLGKH